MLQKFLLTHILCPFQILRLQHNYLVNWSVRTNNSDSLGSQKIFLSEGLFFLRIIHTVSTSSSICKSRQKTRLNKAGKDREFWDCILSCDSYHLPCVTTECLHLRPSRNLVKFYVHPIYICTSSYTCIYGFKTY